MKIVIADELKDICRAILEENKTSELWSEIESDDLIQTPSFVGGFDATENAFCFSYYDNDGNEFWFQLTLDEVAKVVANEKLEVELRPAAY